MSDKKDEPIEAELVPVVPQGPRAVAITPKQLRAQMAREIEMRSIINEFIANNMVEGKDFGSIEVKKGSGIMSKPSLLKPGAEKFCGLFKIRPTFRVDNDTREMLGNTPGIICYICELVDTRGLVIGEGRGTSKTDPVHGLDFDINKQVKIAQKRAQVDAVLRTGGLSDFFTQDMEDSGSSGSRGRMATEKQIKAIYGSAQRLTGIEHKDDLDEWLVKTIGGKPDDLSLKAAGQALGKLFAAEKEMRENAGQQSNQTPDTVIDVTDQDLTDLENGDLPY